MTDQWRPSQYDEHEPAANDESAPLNTKLYAAIAGAVVVVAGVVAVLAGVIDIRPSAESVALEVVEQPLLAPVFQPAAEEGDDPFFPLEVQLAAYQQETGETPSDEEIATGIWGGTAEKSCDPQKLIDFLMSNPDRGQAWAHVQGIEYEDIPAYINTLTVRLLAAPATVLNHHFDEATGQPYQIETTLDTDTAVLVDENGDIRARCFCGNPVLPKQLGDRPPRCLVAPQMVYTRPGGSDERDGAPSSVVLTGRMSTDMTWTEVLWGQAEEQSGWTPTNNVSANMCLEAQPASAQGTVTPAPATPNPAATAAPGATATPRPRVTPTPRATPRPTATAAPIARPTATPIPQPTATSVPAPTPSPTPLPQPFQPYCSVSKRNLVVGETTEISAGHVPDSVQVQYTIAHGDGTLDSNNPSIATYLAPGTYLASANYVIDGVENFVSCGTIDVSPGGATYRCSISSTTILAGGTTTFTGSSEPANLPVTWIFDHGDGYREQSNPSVSRYPNVGSYNVTAFATLNGVTTELFCGTVTVTVGTNPVIICSTQGYVGLPLADAQALATSRGCAWRLAEQPGDTQYRTDRVNFTHGHGQVTKVTVG